MSPSTLADLMGHATVALAPIHALIKNHMLAAHRAKGSALAVQQLRSTIVLGPMAAKVLLHFSRNNESIHPKKHVTGWQGILQTDVYTGYNVLYQSDLDPGSGDLLILLEPRAARVLRAG